MSPLNDCVPRNLDKTHMTYTMVTTNNILCVKIPCMHTEYDSTAQFTLIISVIMVIDNM